MFYHRQREKEDTNGGVWRWTDQWDGNYQETNNLDQVQMVTPPRPKGDFSPLFYAYSHVALL